MTSPDIKPGRRFIVPVPFSKPTLPTTQPVEILPPLGTPVLGALVDRFENIQKDPNATLAQKENAREQLDQFTKKPESKPTRSDRDVTLFGESGIKD